MTAIGDRQQAETINPPAIPDYQTIEETVLAWPQEAQVRLMHQVLNRLVPQGAEMKTDDLPSTTNQTGFHRGNAMELVGRLNFVQPAPTDEEVAQIIEEARLAKYAPEVLEEMRRERQK